MRRFRDIIEDIKAPSVQDLWLLLQQGVGY